MPNAAVGASPSGATATSGGGSAASANPFQIATNLYCEKNLQGFVTSQVLTSGAIQQGGSVNAGQYLRCVRIMLRTTAAGTGTAATVSADGPPALFSGMDLTNVDGSEILFNMNGFAYLVREKYFRPWLCDPMARYDWIAAVGGSTPSAGACTISLMPEIRFSAGVLANTDTRSQYRFDYTLNGGSLFLTGMTTYPTVTVIPFMDAWAQPDATDLQGTPNQPVPPGVNLQSKARHQLFQLNGVGTDNTLLSTLTGNALRAMAIICRNSAGVRADAFTDPFYWYLDNRSLGRLNPDMIRQWQEDFYSGARLEGFSTANTGATATGGVATAVTTNNNAIDPIGATGIYTGCGSEDVGVYVFPRWIDPGNLNGQGWLYSANSTKLLFESSTATAGGSGATAELISDEVYPVGQVDPNLVDI
jgi:hypothetical protein